MALEINKNEIANTIRDNYFTCDRKCAHDYIKTGLFTEDELVNKFGLLTARAYNHILKYPRLYDEQEPLPILSLDNPTHNIIIGNVDVLFFGVCGSGGKTCLMASLMSLIGESSDFLYQEYNGNKECDNAYGSYLAEYMKTNRLPPATDTCCIQVVNTFIKCSSKYKGVSFIEFAGEQVAGLAGNSKKEGMTDGSLIPSLVKILNNRNKKIIFLTLDPTNLKDIQIVQPTEDKEGLAVYQSDVLSCVISHFKNNPTFMHNVIGFHTILSKSDTWLKGSLSTSIEQAINAIDANGLLLQIQQLCEVYKINKQLNEYTDLIPFSIGRFMMGDTYEFDNSDARKLLQLIKKDIMVSESERSILSRLKDYFNN